MNRKISTSFAVLMIIAWAGFFITILWLSNKEKERKPGTVSSREAANGDKERINYDDLERLDRQDPQENPSNPARKIGYVKSVYEKNGKRYLNMDYIEWLEGENAQRARLEDGQCKKNEECLVENDYYIRNKDKKTEILEISGETPIIMQTLNMEKEGIVWNREVEFDLFKLLFLPASSNKYKEIPFIVKIDGKNVTKITEQYVP